MAAEARLWVDEYAPRRAAELVGNAKAIAELAKRIEAWTKPVLVCGPPGTGKTSAAHLLATSRGYEVKELNASMTRSSATVRAFMAEFVSSGEKGHASAPKTLASLLRARPRFLVIDEVDGMAGNVDHGGMKELIAAAKRASVPVVFIANEEPSSPRVKPLATAFGPAVRFYKLERRDIETLARRVLAAALKRAPTPDEYRAIAARAIDECAALGDVRSVVNRMQFLHQSARAASLPREPTAYALPAAKQAQVWLPDANEGAYVPDASPFERVAVLLSAPQAPLEHRLAQCAEDPFTTNAMAWESYVQQPGGMVQGNLSAMHKAADAFSRADTVERAIMSGQYASIKDAIDGLSSVRDVIGTISAARLAAVPRVNYGANRAPVVKFPSLLGHVSATNANARLLRQLAGVMGVNARDLADGGGAFLAARIADHVRRGQLDAAAEMLRAYRLTHETWESLVKASAWHAPEKLDAAAAKAWKARCQELGLGADERAATAELVSAEESLARTDEPASGKRKRT